MIELRSRRGWLLVGSVLTSGIFLYLALRDMDFNGLATSMASLRPWPVALAALATLASIVLRGERWRLVSGDGAAMHWQFVRAANLGLLANQLLPGRAGEVVKIFVISRSAGVSLVRALGSAFVDRVLDVLVLLVSVTLVMALASAQPIPLRWATGLGGVLALAVLGAWLIVTQGDRILRCVAPWIERFARRWGLRSIFFLEELAVELRRLGRPRSAGAVTLATLAVWGVDYVGVAAALGAAGLLLPPVAPLLLWVLLAAGSTLPSAPGYIGIYQLAAVLALATYGVPAHQAVAVALVLQGVTLAVSLVMAGPAALRVFGWARTKGVDTHN